MTEKQKEFETETDDGRLKEIEQLVFRINQLTEIIKEIDAMPIVRKINGRPF